MKTNNNISEYIKKKILLISYHFPPSTAVGGLRIANFAKYLPLHGWNSYVLTIKDHYLKKVDQDRIKDIGSVKVFKTRIVPKINAYLRLKCFYLSLLKRRIISPKELNNYYIPQKCYSYNEQSLNTNYYNSEKISKKLKRYSVSFVSMPDIERNWILPAVFRAVREIKREKIDCILTSSPPHSIHLTGLLVKMITGVRWIADFRDPWVTGGPLRLDSTCAFSKMIERWMEQKVVQNADMVLTTTETLCDALKESYKTLPESNFLCVTNGFDKEFFARLNHVKKYEMFTLTYAGGLYYGRTPEPIFKSLKELALEKKISLQNIRVKLIGDCKYVNGCPISQMIHSYGLDSVVEVLEPVSYSKAVEIIRQSHLALLFAPDQPFQIPAKVFDYMGTRTNILALSKEGATSDLINSTGIGTVFHPSDINGIKAFIYESIINGDSLKENNSLNIFDKYDRKIIIQKLADHLDRLFAK